MRKRSPITRLVSAGAWYAALLFAALAGAYTYLTTIDFSYLAPRIERYVKAETGVELKIAGSIGFASPVIFPGVYMDDVTLAPRKETEVAPVHAGRLEIRFNPLFLFGFDGTTHISEFAVREADFTLAVGRRQASFVDFLDAARTMVASAPVYYGTLIVDRVRFRDSELVYEAGGARPARHVPFEDLRFTGLGEDAGMEFVGRFGGESYVLSGTLSSYRDVLDGGTSSLELTGALGSMFIGLSGDLVDLSTLNLNLTYKILGSDLTPLAKTLGLAAVQPYHGLSLEGDISGNLGEGFQSRLAGEVGRGALNGALTLDLTDRPVLSAEFQSQELDLTPFLPANGPAMTYDALVDDQRFDVAKIGSQNWSVELGAESVRLGDSLFGAANVSSALKDGRFELDLRQNMADDGYISVTASYNVHETGELMLTTRANVTETAALFAGLGIEASIDVPAHLVSELSSEGLSQADLLRNAAGQLNFVLDDGRIGAEHLQQLSEWIGATVIGGSTPGTTRINCMIGRIDVSNGIAISEALFVDTAAEFATGSGSVNFKGDKIELALRSRPKDPRALDQAFDVSLTGPLWAPVITEEKQDVARGIASPLALFTTRESSAEALPLFGEDLPLENACVGPLIGS